MTADSRYTFDNAYAIDLSELVPGARFGAVVESHDDINGCFWLTIDTGDPGYIEDRFVRDLRLEPGDQVRFVGRSDWTACIERLSMV